MNSQSTARTITAEIVDLVADAADESPSELAPLGTQIDTDALNRLLSSRLNTTLELRFEYEGYLVSIEKNGTVKLDEADGLGR